MTCHGKFYRRIRTASGFYMPMGLNFSPQILKGFIGWKLNLKIWLVLGLFGFYKFISWYCFFLWISTQYHFSIFPRIFLQIFLKKQSIKTIFYSDLQIWPFIAPRRLVRRLQNIWWLVGFPMILSTCRLWNATVFWLLGHRVFRGFQLFIPPLHPDIQKI